MGKKPVVKEAAIERMLGDAVRARGGEYIKVRAIGRRGFFDRIIALPGGRVIFAEIKKPKGGKIAPHQRRYHGALHALGVEACFVLTPEDIVALFK